MTRMAREIIPRPGQIDKGYPHAGLFLDRCLSEYPDDSTKKGEVFTSFIDQTCRIPVCELYKKAYARWLSAMIDRAANKFAALWCGKVDGRLFLGTGGPSPLEAAVTLHHTYGLPLLPGSALKGLTHGYTREQQIDPNLCAVLFGRGPGNDGDHWNGGEAGYVIFHDAWWIPQEKTSDCPLTPEIVTVHHPEYYQKHGDAFPTDLDSPTPNAQIAIQGSFLFAIEGIDGWARYAMKLLRYALQDWGAGAKTAAGYGYFIQDKQIQRKVDIAVAENTPRPHPDSNDEDKLRSHLESWKNENTKELAKRFKKNKTYDELKVGFPGVDRMRMIAIIDEIHGATLSNWQDSKKSNEREAFDTWIKQTTKHEY